MSKKPLVRSKKRAVHTNTKDKLSKLIAEVDSIAKELSKVKKGGLGDMSKMTGGDSIFDTIWKMLKGKGNTISELKIEYINLLIKGKITSWEEYKEYKEYKIDNIQTIYEFIPPIKIITQNLLNADNIYGYDILNIKDPNYDVLNQIDKDNIIKLAHILNIFKYLYSEVLTYKQGEENIKPSDNYISTYFTNKFNKILLSDNDVVLVSRAKSGAEGWNEHKNIIKQGVSTMAKLKNDLIEKIFIYADILQDDNNMPYFKNLYNAINNKTTYGYDFLNIGLIEDNEVINRINKLNKIKLTYDILNYIYDNVTLNIIDDVSFSFDKDLLGDKSINTIEKLKRAIKGLKTIQTVDEKRTKINFQIVTRFFRDKGQFENIETILKNLKTDFILITEKNKNYEANKNKINNDPNVNDKLNKITQLNYEISNLNKNITERIDELNNIKDALILDYNNKNNVSETDEKKNIVEMFKNQFYIKLKKIGFEDKYLEHFISDNSDNKNTTVSTDSTVETDNSDDLTKRLGAIKKQGGKLVTKYKSTGESVYILYKRKKIKRCVYVKAKGRGKYCKVDGEYKLLSKLKIM